MTTLSGGQDRAKASEHAIFLLRELHAPGIKIAAILPHVADRLAGNVSLVVPAVPAESGTLPIELLLAPSAEPVDWKIELRLPSGDGVHDFFEGDIRLDGLSAPTTHVVLIGRFRIPAEYLQRYVDENALRDMAEDNLIRIFEQVLLAVESTILSAER